MNNRVVDYTKWILKMRWLVILAVIGVFMGIASGGRFIVFSNDYRYFFSEANPNLVAFEKLERTYTSPDTLMVVLKPEEGLATSAEVLEIVKDITTQSWQTPYSTRVDSITNYQHTRAYDDDLVVADLVTDPGALSKDGLQEVRDIATSEPAIALRLISDDAKTTAILTTLKLPKDDVVANSEAVSHARNIVADMREKHPDIRFELTGSAMLSNAFAEAGQSDLSTITPIMYGIIALTVYLLVRSFSAVFATMVVVGLSAVSALGLVMGWLGVPMTPPSAGAPTVILTIAVADSIHIIVSMLMAMRHGMSKHEAIVESMRINWQPVMLTSLTTAIGFLSLNFSDAPPFRDLGNASAAGAILAWILSITLLPALLSILPIKAKGSISKQSDLMEKFANMVINQRKGILVGMAILIVAFLSLLPRFTFDDRFVEYFDKSIEFRTATDFASDNLTGIYQISYSVEADETGGISNPEYLKALEEFTIWYRQQPEVVHVASFTDVIKRVNKSMNADNQDFYLVPDEREMAAQYLLLYEMSLPYGLDLNDQINVDKSATKLTITLESIATSELSNLISRAEQWQSANLPSYMQSAPAGQSVMFSFIGWSNFKAMVLGTAIALVLISGCLVLALRNVRLGAISLIPNLTPPIVAFGVLALFTPVVGFWSSFVISTALGLIVDATVHFLSKYQRARTERNADAVEAVRYAFSTVGTALWVCTFVLVIGFAVLALSPFKINAMLGTMVALTITCALVIDFLLLPALLITLDRDKSKASDTTAYSPQTSTN